MEVLRFNLARKVTTFTTPIPTNILVFYFPCIFFLLGFVMFDLNDVGIFFLGFVDVFDYLEMESVMKK